MALGGVYLTTSPMRVAAQEAAPPAADAAAAPAAAPAAEGAAAPAAEGEAAHVEEESALIWIAKTSGWIGAGLLALSFYFVALVAENFMRLRPGEAMPAEVVEQAEEYVKAKDFPGLYKFLKAEPSFFSQVSAAGMAELQHGWTETREAMDDVGETMVVDMERRISMLAVIGSLGPMIGLLGTLKGMISSFSVIARSDTQMKASEVAHGISEALLLTFEGVAISVPAIWFFTYFKNRIAVTSTETMVSAVHFVRQLNAIRLSKAAPAAAPAAKQPG